ncbi:putative F-box protein PP2-B12 [Apium graveolens]|uniref:putative F-box protein PP2-B12 n=1 Tax=Apium graveolens TaxID=4045 RepID=UPI003D7A536E
MANMLGMNALPQKLIEEIVSRTSPGDACGSLSLVSKKFRSAANSDHVWQRFLPLHKICRRAGSDRCVRDDPWRNIDSDTLHAFATIKDLYLFLSDNPLLIYDDYGDCTYFCLEKLSGKQCFRIGARDLLQIDPKGWSVCIDMQPSLTYSWSDIAFLWRGVNLEVEAKISTSLLSPNTNYTAYLLVDISCHDSDFFEFGAEGSFETWVGIDGHGENKNVYVPQKKDKPVLITKHDSWYEVELGDYFNKGLSVGSTELRMSLREVKSGRRKGSLFIYGIEIRPKSSKN